MVRKQITYLNKVILFITLSILYTALFIIQLEILRNIIFGQPNPITKMKAQENPSDPAEVVKPHLKSMLNGPFSVPRSHEWDSVDDHQPNKVVFVYTFFANQ